MVLVLLTAAVKRVGVSRMWDFFFMSVFDKVLLSAHVAGSSVSRMWDVSVFSLDVWCVASVSSFHKVEVPAVGHCVMS